MAARATKAEKRAASPAAVKPVRKSGKPQARAAKHSAAPKRPLKAATGRAKQDQPAKAKPAGKKGERPPKSAAASAKAPAKQTRAKSASAKGAKPLRTPKKAAAPPASAAKATKSAAARAKAANEPVKKKSSKKPAVQSAKTVRKGATKTSKAVKQPKTTAKKSKSAPKPTAAAPAAKVALPAGTPAPAPPKGKRIRRAPAPPPAAAAPPGRIVAKGVPMAPEPRSPAEEKQRMKDALAARELAVKQQGLYEKAVAQFNRRKFARALPLFEQAAEGPQVALRDRARVYAQICRQRTEESKIQLRNAEDYYNYGVKLLNDRELEDAAAHLSEALRRNPKAAHAHYATAVLHALNHNNTGVYESLKKAIELDPQNRHLALHDSDLSMAKRDPAVYQLLHSNVFAPPAS